MDDTKTITITQTRYESLIKAETLLEAVCRTIRVKEDYGYSSYQAIVGKDLLPDKGGDEE